MLFGAGLIVLTLWTHLHMNGVSVDHWSAVCRGDLVTCRCDNGWSVVHHGCTGSSSEGQSAAIDGWVHPSVS